jgi:hypothetical protein
MLWQMDCVEFSMLLSIEVKTRHTREIEITSNKYELLLRSDRPSQQ